MSLGDLLFSEGTYRSSGSGGEGEWGEELGWVEGGEAVFGIYCMIEGFKKIAIWPHLQIDRVFRVTQDPFPRTFIHYANNSHIFVLSNELLKFLQKQGVHQRSKISAFQKLKFHVFLWGGINPSSLWDFCSMGTLDIIEIWFDICILYLLYKIYNILILSFFKLWVFNIKHIYFYHLLFFETK